MSASEVKRLHRSRDNRMIGGVAAGLGEYLGIDPTLVRLIFIFGAFFGVGSFIIIYVVMLIIVPETPLASEAVVEAPAPETEAKPKRATRRKTTTAKKPAAKKPAAKKTE